jgi:hypothetical protein
MALYVAGGKVLGTSLRTKNNKGKLPKTVLNAVVPVKHTPKHFTDTVISQTTLGLSGV